MKEWWKRPPSEKSARIIFYCSLLFIITSVLGVLTLVKILSIKNTNFTKTDTILIEGVLGGSLLMAFFVTYPMYKKLYGEQ